MRWDTFPAGLSAASVVTPGAEFAGGKSIESHRLTTRGQQPSSSTVWVPIDHTRHDRPSRWFCAAAARARLAARGSTLSVMPSCIFCGAHGKLTREHVFPRWLEALFPDLGDVDYVRRTVTHTSDDRHERPGRPFDLVARNVCSSCNSGWMSELESAAQSILTPMLRDEARVLSAVEQHTVATWAVKTMLTVQGTNIGGESFVPVAEYRWFYEHRTPLLGSNVWLCRYGDRTRWPLSVHQYGITVRPGGDPAPQVGEPINGYGVAFAVGPVAWWLFGHDVPVTDMKSGSDDAHLLIWPALGPDIRWPPLHTLETEAELEQLARHMPTGTAVHGPPLPGP